MIEFVDLFCVFDVFVYLHMHFPYVCVQYLFDISFLVSPSVSWFFCYLVSQFVRLFVNPFVCYTFIL